MTQRKTDLTESAFRRLLGREIAALLAGKRTTSQLEHWLLSLSVGGGPLALSQLRIETIMGAVCALGLSLRAEKGGETKRGKED